MLNAIVNEKDINWHELISTCTVTKEAWDTLPNIHERDNLIEHSKFQNVSTEFENIKMH